MGHNGSNQPLGNILTSGMCKLECLFHSYMYAIYKERWTAQEAEV